MKGLRPNPPFWAAVEECLVEFHGSEPQKAAKLSKSLRNQLSAQKLTADLIYHDEPYFVACSLAGKECGVIEDFKHYEEILARAKSRKADKGSKTRKSKEEEPVTSTGFHHKLAPSTAEVNPLKKISKGTQGITSATKSGTAKDLNEKKPLIVIGHPKEQGLSTAEKNLLRKVLESTHKIPSATKADFQQELMKMLSKLANAELKVRDFEKALYEAKQAAKKDPSGNVHSRDKKPAKAPVKEKLKQGA